VTRQLAEVAPGVLVATGKQYTTTSTVVLGTGGGCLVVDPAVSVAEVTGLAGELAARGLRAQAGWATHPHWDHVLWCAELGDAPRWAAPKAVQTAARERTGLIEGVQDAAPGHDLALFGALVQLDGQVIPWDGPVAQVVVHDGHAPGHGAVWLPDSGTLLAGDMCSDIEIPLPDMDQADPFGDYQAGLDLLAVLPVRQVVPGHGHVGDAAEFRRRVDADRSYLDQVRAGRRSDDPRLTEVWLVAEHHRHVQLGQR
jgi:hydroxyacylglutathione hydrolase